MTKNFFVVCQWMTNDWQTGNVLLPVVTSPSHRKPAPHHWLGRMVHLCTPRLLRSTIACTAGLPLPASYQIDPVTPEQRDLIIRSIVKFPYLLYVTIICVLFPIVV